MTPFLANLIFSMILLTLTAAVFVVPSFLLKRAIGQVIRIFRRSHSVCSEGTKTAEELGLQPPDFFEKLAKPKDYKPFALDALVETGIVRVEEDGKLCLLEEKLRESPLNADEGDVSTKGETSRH